MAVDHNNPQSRDEEILIATIDGEEYDKIPQSRMEELLLELKEVIEEGGGGGTSDYENLTNQPQVNGETLIGNKTGADLGLVDAEEGKVLSTNDYDDNEKSAVAAATSAISAMKDGTDIDSFGDVEIALLDKADISDLGTAAVKNSTNAVTSGSTDLVESGAVKDAIDSAVSSAYHHAGTKTVAQLTHDLLIAANEGNVYNITDSGTTTSDFIEGIGKTIDEGSNVGICKVGNTYMFDLLSGFVDTTNFVQKSATAGLLKNDGTVNDEIQGDITSLKSGLTTLDNEVNGDATVYPYADVITVEDAVPANLADCSVKVEPVQDLHGYDKPWVGGAGKNKLPMTVDGIKAANTSGTWSGNDYTVNGVTFTIQMDDGGNITGIKVTGTSTSTTNLFIANGMSADSINGRIMNGCPANGGADKYAIYCMNTNYGVVGSDFGGGVTLSNTEYNCQVFIQIANGYAIPTGGLTFYPMIRLATETDSTFAPYTNICPISGHTEASVQRDGVNLFDPDHYETFDLTGEGVNLRYGHQYGTGTYTIINNGSNMWYYRVPTKDLSDRGTTQNISAGSSVNVTVDSSHILWVFCQNWVTDSPDDICVRIGSTTPYVPYAGNTYTIALGDTIYGGTVDFDSGVMTVDREYLYVDGSDTSILTVVSGQLQIAISSASTTNTDKYHPVGDLVCNCFKEIYNNSSSQNGIYYRANGSHNLLVRGYGYTAETTLSDWVQWLSNEPLQIVYGLSTPTTIQLTPQQIQLLQGQNTLTASTGQISVTVNGVAGSIGAVQEQVNEIAENVAEKQNATDNSLTTTNKTIVGGINEVNSNYKGIAKGYYSSAITKDVWYRIGHMSVAQTSWILRNSMICYSGVLLKRIQLRHDPTDGFNTSLTKIESIYGITGRVGLIFSQNNHTVDIYIKAIYSDQATYSVLSDGGEGGSLGVTFLTPEATTLTDSDMSLLES